MACQLQPTRVDMHSSRLGTEKSVKCNVLFVIDQLCELGGAEKVLLNTIDLLDRDRFAPSVLTFKIDSSIPAFAKIPSKRTVLPLPNTWDLNGIKTALRLRRLIKEDSIHIVHTFFETSDLWAGPIARLSGVPVI